MGLGKTVTTLTAIQELRDDYCETDRVLVIAPKSVAENTWTSECAKWDHLAHLRVSVVMGDERRRHYGIFTPNDYRHWGKAYKPAETKETPKNDK